MSFNNVETRFPNLFLARTPHNETCFCQSCRNRQLTSIRHKSNETLRRNITIDIPNERRARSNAVFEVTKTQMIHGKLYKEMCLENSGYTQFKSWAKTQPVYQRYKNGTLSEKREFYAHCRLVNSAAHAFDNWNKIVHNLTDQRMTGIDARMFSVNYFAAAVSYNWCVAYNEKILCRGPPTEMVYSKEQIADIVRYIVATGILSDIEYDEHLAARIGSQIQGRIISFCQRQHEN